MSKRDLPALQFSRPKGVSFLLPQTLLDKWDESLRVQAGAGDDATITIFDVIGYDWWTGEGVTAKRIAAALRSIGEDNPVTVLINSPGGDMFEGIAIYELLRAHRGHVTVKVIGLAASAASVIAMAGDTIQIGRPSFYMIHNAWIVVAGDRNAMAEYSEWLKPFDAAMADLYSHRTGNAIDDVSGWMDKEKWMGGSEAVELGFADELLDADPETAADGEEGLSALRQVEVALRQTGVPRSRARALLKELKASKPGAAGESDMPGAVDLSETAALAASLTLPSLEN